MPTAKKRNVLKPKPTAFWKSHTSNSNPPSVASVRDQSGLSTRNKLVQRLSLSDAAMHHICRAGLRLLTSFTRRGETQAADTTGLR